MPKFELAEPDKEEVTGKSLEPKGPTIGETVKKRSHHKGKGLTVRVMPDIPPWRHPHLNLNDKYALACKEVDRLTRENKELIAERKAAKRA